MKQNSSCGCHDHDCDHNHSHIHEHEHMHGEIETCGCGHCHGFEKENKTPQIVLTAIGAVLIAASFLPFFGETVEKIFLIFSAVICGLPVVTDALKSLFKFKIDESLLMLIAVIAAFLIGEYFEAAAVSVLFAAGQLMEDFASDKSRKSIEAVFGIVSDEANIVKADGTIEKIDADDVEIDNILAILPHETVPVDGIVIDGESSVDASALTGESLPMHVCQGSVVSSGMINGDSTFHIKATAIKNQSSAARIVEMVEQAAQKKGEAQRAVATFTKYYTPAVIAAAVLTAVVPSLFTGEWHNWIYRSLVLLMASCPCAVVISAPLAFFSTMGAAAKNGMIIKGSRYIESLAKADTAVFDKTGTLTTGELTVANVYAEDGYGEKDVISLAAKCEYYSTHPIAEAIKTKCGEISMKDVTDFSEIAGGGTSVLISDNKVLCGGKRLMEKNFVDVSSLPNAPVYVALNGKAVGAVDVEGKVCTQAPETVKKLRKLGVEHSLILTGDSAKEARKVCGECGIDDFRSNLLPEDKLNALEEIKDGAGGVIYVGDGINDAPVLAAADVGIAMGLGTHAAGEAADVILTDSNISKLADTVYQCKRTMSVLKTNIAFAVLVKFAVMILGIVGIAPMWLAVFADVGTMIICVANSAKLLKIKKY